MAFLRSVSALNPFFGRRIYPGRWTAHEEDGFAVLIIGFRANKLRALARWIRVGYSMLPMVRELRDSEATGFLASEFYVYWRGAMFVQYWRSFEDIENYARDRERLHVPAWQDYYERFADDDSVGVWHETYRIQPGAHEAVYNNMPRFGLANVGEHVPATGRFETARRRLGDESEPLFEPPENPAA